MGTHTYTERLMYTFCNLKQRLSGVFFGSVCRHFPRLVFKSSAAFYWVTYTDSGKNFHITPVFLQLSSMDSKLASSSLVPLRGLENDTLLCRTSSTGPAVPPSSIPHLALLPGRLTCTCSSPRAPSLAALWVGSTDGSSSGKGGEGCTERSVGPRLLRPAR